MDRIKKIYLAGGFKSGWQDIVISSIKNNGVRFLDPRKHGIKSSDEYTEWDLNAVRESDILFAFMEANNPGGYALALEIGYAKALGKTIIFIDDVHAHDPARSRFLDMLRSSADFSCYTMQEGITSLVNLVK